MRFYDENMNEIYIYKYSESSFDSCINAFFFTYDPISVEDRDLAEKEYAQFLKLREESIEKSKIDSGFNSLISRRDTKHRATEEESVKIMTSYQKMVSEIPNHQSYLDFVIKKFDLKEIKEDMEF